MKLEKKADVHASRAEVDHAVQLTPKIKKGGLSFECPTKPNVQDSLAEW